MLHEPRRDEAEDDSRCNDRDCESDKRQAQAREIGHGMSSFDISVRSPPVRERVPPAKRLVRFTLEPTRETVASSNRAERDSSRSGLRREIRRAVARD